VTGSDLDHAAAGSSAQTWLAAEAYLPNRMDKATLEPRRRGEFLKNFRSNFCLQLTAARPPWKQFYGFAKAAWKSSSSTTPSFQSRRRRGAGQSQLGNNFTELCSADRL